MKNIPFLVLIFFCLAAAAQKKPTQAEMQQQMKEAMKEIEALEKENPEAAKMAKQLLQQMQQVQGGTKTTTTKDQPLSGFTSPVVAIPLKSPVPTPTEANAADRLLWYKGKKINDSMLVTTQGLLVLYNRKKNRLVVQPKKEKDGFDRVVRELVQTEQRKQDLIGQFARTRNSFFFYPQIINTLKEYDEIANRYKKIVKNTIELPPAAVQTKPPAHTGKGGWTDEPAGYEEIPPALKQAYQGVLDRMKAAPSLDFPPPPERENDMCYACDSNTKKQYDQELHQWDSLFLEYESGLVRDAIGVQRSLDLLYTPGEEAELQSMKQDMDKVMAFGFKRQQQKVEMLTERYGRDFKRLSLVIHAVLALERQKQLYGSDENAYGNAMEKVFTLMKGFDDYLREQINNRNYPVIFNLAFIIGMERQKQLLGMEEGKEVEYINMVNAFNRFKLKMDMTFEAEGNDSEGKLEFRASGEMVTDKDVFVSLGLYKCKYQLYLHNTDYGQAQEEEYRIPMVITGGEKTVRIKDNEYRTYPYTGPRDVLTVFPLFRIGYCDNGRDSAYIEIPTYKEDAGKYLEQVKNGYSVDFMGFMNWIFFDVAGMEGKVGDMEKLGKDMLSAFTNPQAIQPTGNGRLDEMQKEYIMSMELQDKQGKMSALTLINKLLFLFDARNRSETLIDEKTDAARQIAENTKLVKGIVHLKVVHAPEDYNPKPLRNPLVKQ